jgi:GNAT superfamily N-acetyltransferase
VLSGLNETGRKRNNCGVQRSELVIEVVNEPAESDEEYLTRQLVQYNAAQAGPSGWKPLAVFVRDQEGVLQGGMTGFTHWSWLFIACFWLPESLRRIGLGTEVLYQAEEEAQKRGCSNAHLDTFDFQALPFYQKNGYGLFGKLDGYPTGHQRYFLTKRLIQGSQSGNHR